MCENYKLVPSIYVKHKGSLAKYERSMIDDFTSLSSNKYKYSTNRYIEEMLMAQHYDLPTRLQDWSESALTALYFAVHVENEEKRTEDSILWALDPVKLNLNIPFISQDKPIPNLISSSIDKSYESKIEDVYIKNEENNQELYPIALNARKINSRIEAQRGVFVLFPRINSHICTCLTEYKGAGEFLYKIVIKKANARTLLKNLTDIGLSQYSLFPEIESIAIDVKEKYLKRVTNNV